MKGKEVRVGACIFAGDVGTMVRFYRDTLGLYTDWEGGDFAEFDFECVGGFGSVERADDGFVNRPGVESGLHSHKAHSG